MVETITLYTAKASPFAQRVELALEESGAKYETFQVDLRNKPEWYAPKVNPASKVPAIAYGGPPVPPSQPSPESTKLAESLILLEFVADLFPTSHLLPKSPVQRAKARFFIDAVSTKFLPKFLGFVVRGKAEGGEALYKAIEELQALIEGKYALGDEWSIADAALTPFLARLELSLRKGFGGFKEGEGTKLLGRLKEGTKFEVFWKYFENVTQRESFKKTFDEDYLVSAYEKRFGNLRAQSEKKTA
ncbi:hypothetical protein JAAARDRAFT_197211 [Jaapia argillacea MUCL 33604]|uniref:GST N-terminal domain-containing protein n=1 Tax=Jaapia argillacea MUCL 33604 TaxID=933084 RepID=A0A067PIU8_9AGAM|nr:hypothetical protein JAAARDRAFT_197211 [Jaapia argillacea MUCL 33604]